jgi:hypothetical protein
MKGLVKGIPKGFQQNLVGSITNFAIDTGTKGRVIPIVFSPSSLSDSVQASFTQTTIPGASAPQVTYTATGARTVSLSLELPLDYLPPSSDYTDFEDYLNAFRALVYPKYATSGGKVESPHCKLVTSNIEIDGVCTQCSIEYRTDRFANDGSMSAEISLSFLEVLDNVKNVDAKWIANSKVKVLGTTTMTLQTSNSDSFINSSTSSVTQDDKCTITLLGNTNMNVSNNTFSILDAQKSGKFVDPGYTYTRKDKYTIKRFCGYTEDSTASISDIVINSSSGSGTCVCNGKSRSLNSGLINGDSYSGIDTITYFLIYIPVYDGNNYEVNSSKIRYVHLTKVVG